MLNLLGNDLGELQYHDIQQVNDGVALKRVIGNGH